MPLKKCAHCGGEFEPYSKSRSIKYCGDKCNKAVYYQNNKEAQRERDKKWQKLNPERYRELHKKSLNDFIKRDPEGWREKMREAGRKDMKKHPLKRLSRGRTKSIIHGNKNLELKKQCKCGSKIDLEIHHEIYPTKKEEIIKAIKKGKIYYKCRRCRGRRNGHKI